MRDHIQLDLAEFERLDDELKNNREGYWGAKLREAAEAASSELTWVMVNGEKAAAIVPPEFGLLAELLMRHDAKIEASINRPDGTVQQITRYPAWACSDDNCPHAQEPHTTGIPGCIAGTWQHCPNCGYSQAEHCRTHLRQHCPGYCPGNMGMIDGVSEVVEAWTVQHTWTGPDQRPPGMRAKLEGEWT